MSGSAADNQAGVEHLALPSSKSLLVPLNAEQEKKLDELHAAVEPAMQVRDVQPGRLAVCLQIGWQGF